MEKVSIITSAYNEEAGIRDFLVELSKVRIPGAKVEFIAVDNGSRDKTGRIMDEFKGKPGFTVIHNKPPTKGLIEGLKTAFDHATGDYIAIIRSDWQEDPHDIPAIFKELKKRDLDCIVGWRKNRLDPGMRLVLSRIFNFLTRIIYSFDVADVNGAPKLFKSKYIRDYDFKSKRFIIDLELLWLIDGRGGKIGWCAVKHFARRAGKATVGVMDVLRMAYDFFAFSLKYRFSKPPAPAK